MKRSALLKAIEPMPAPYQDNDSVSIISHVEFFDGADVLCLDLYWKEQLRGRYFADHKTHNAYVSHKWYTSKLNAIARMCKDETPLKTSYYYWGADYYWETEEDKKRALDYLQTYSVESYEDDLNRKKYNNRLQRKADRIDAIMDEIDCVPEDMEKWLQETVFPDYMFVQKMGSGKRTKYSCTSCGSSSWTSQKLKHGQKWECPKCGKQVKVWSRNPEREERQNVVLLQPYMHEEPEMHMHVQRWAERQFHAVCSYRWGEKKEIELNEDLRALIRPGENWGELYYGLYQDGDEFEQDWWDKNSANKHFMKSMLYPGNLDEVLPIGNLEHSGMKELADRGIKFHVNKYLVSFSKKPYLEYMVKAGLFTLAVDIVDRYYWWGDPKSINVDGRNMKQVLQLDGDHLFRMKSMNGSLNMLEWLQWQQDEGHFYKISSESLEFLDKKQIYVDSLTDFIDEIGSVNRAVNYIRKQKGRADECARLWRDYIRMAEEEGRDIHDDIVRFPKDLKLRHDELMEIINNRRSARMAKEQAERNAKKYAELNAKIVEHLPDVKRLFWENKDYMLIPAGTCEELVTEGQTLHHCVGSSTTYMDRMAAGKSWILFLRKKEDLEKPYYTIEISMEEDKIIQWYSEYDRKPDKDVISQLLNRYTEQLKIKNLRQTT